MTYDMICYDMKYMIYYAVIWYIWYDMLWYIIYLTPTGLPPGGSSTVHIYTQIIHRTTQSTQTTYRTTHFTN